MCTSVGSRNWSLLHGGAFWAARGVGGGTTREVVRGQEGRGMEEVEVQDKKRSLLRRKF